VAKGFKVHERDSHVDRLLMALHGLLPIPRDFHSKIKELTFVDLYHFNFH
jgi:hypothetical protein